MYTSIVLTQLVYSYTVDPRIQAAAPEVPWPPFPWDKSEWSNLCAKTQNSVEDLFLAELYLVQHFLKSCWLLYFVQFCTGSCH